MKSSNKKYSERKKRYKKDHLRRMRRKAKEIIKSYFTKAPGHIDIIFSAIAQDRADSWTSCGCYSYFEGKYE